MMMQSKSFCGRAFSTRPLSRPSLRCPVVASLKANEGRTQSAQDEASSSLPASPNMLARGVAMLTPFLLPVGAAIAAEGEFGLLEGRTAALVHPAVMFFLLGATGWAGYLGFQWRRTRTLPEEIKALKAQLPAAAEDGSRPASPLDAQITSLEQERKTLISGNFRDKHAVWGSLLLGMGVVIALEGAVNTYMRTGKLFPGPHLYAGAIMVAMWALAAAMTPAMQKGNEGARVAHITFNTVNALMFISQVPTGLEIVGKVFQFTVWP